jgi:RimJ/RimL family protein N-acetyltransferase
MAIGEGSPSQLERSGMRQLTAALGDTPETVISVHVLRRGLARAHVTGPPGRFAAAIVENLAFNQDELTGFGAAEPLWQLLRDLDEWSSIEVAADVAAALGRLIAAEMGHPPRNLDDIYHVLREAPDLALDARARLLTEQDRSLMEAAQSSLRGAGWGSLDALLRDGIAAGTVVDGKLVALAHTSARTDRYADVGVATLPAWRGQGFATATAALVCTRLLAEGQTPVWSTATTNIASLRVAARLGFSEVSRRTYLVR